jgi:hypothetical protein
MRGRMKLTATCRGIDDMFSTILAAIITALITSLGSGGLLTWYLQTRLKHKYEAAIKKLESELEQQNFRHSTVFVKTEENISSIYEKLLRVLDVLEDYTKIMKDADKPAALAQIKILNDAITDFYQIYHPKKIYIRKKTRNQINDLMNTAISLLRAYNMGEQLRAYGELTPAGQQQLDKLDAKFDELQSKVSPLLISLEDEFQDALGFPKGKS